MNENTPTSLVDVMDDCTSGIKEYSEKFNSKQSPSPQESYDLLAKLMQLKGAAQSSVGQEIPDLVLKMISGPHRALVIGAFADMCIDLYRLRSLLQQVEQAQVQQVPPQQPN